MIMDVHKISIGEAICRFNGYAAHYENQANEIRELKGKPSKKANDFDIIAENNRQVANWLEELKSIQEAKLSEWCIDCKEYDKENHCCHKFTKVIQETVDEVKEEHSKPSWIDAFAYIDMARNNDGEWQEFLYHMNCRGLEVKKQSKDGESKESFIDKPSCPTGDFYIDKVVFDSEGYEIIESGTEYADKIVYHTPKGEGDKHFVDVYKDGRMHRYFVFDSIIGIQE